MNNLVIGAKGGGSAPPPAAATKRSTAIIRAVLALCSGPIEGLVNGGQSIFLDGTPLYDTSNNPNYPRIAFTQRTGEAVQAYIPGFSAVENVVNVNAALTMAVPVIRSVTDGLVDAVNITLLIEKLYYQSGSYGLFVSYEVDTKLTTSSTWTTVFTEVYGPEVILSGYEKDIYIKRPAGTTGQWQFRVRKTIGESPTTTWANDLKIARFTEIIEEQQSYNGTALIAMAFDAGSVGDEMPVPSFLGKWSKVRVPTTYNPATRVYDVGVWNQTFKTEKVWTNNPVWCLLDFLTDVDQGLGAFYNDSNIEMQSFYTAAVYCDQNLTFTNSLGQIINEPRFTLNGMLTTSETPDKWIDSICHSMRANCVWSNGLITLYQDRPADAKRLVTRANMIAGSFIEKETSVRARHTEMNVVFNDATNGYKQRLLTIPADAATVARYDYLSDTQELFGCTSEGQATRYGKWLLDTEAYQYGTVQWQTEREGLNYKVFDVVKVMDQGYSGVERAGRIKSISGTTVVLDRPVTLAGVTDIDIATTDGTFETKRITQTAGTVTTVTLSSLMTKTANDQAVFQVLSGISPRLFRILKLEQDAGTNLVNVEAVYYDVNKFARVEGGIIVPPGKFLDTDSSPVANPTNLNIAETVDYSDQVPRRGLRVEWQKPTVGIPTGYGLRWRVNDGDYVFENFFSAPSYLIRNVTAGTFEVTVYAYGIGVNGTQQRSSGVTTTYTIDVSNATGSLLNAPTNLQVSGTTGGTSFVGPNLKFEWRNPAANADAPVPLRDFEVTLRDSSTAAVIGVYYVDPVAAGQYQSFTYSINQNMADTGGNPRRSVGVNVRCRDTSNKTSTATNATFTNPPPAAVSNIVVSSGTGNIKVTFDRNTDTDIAGYLVWCDQSATPSATFTPSSTNLLSDSDTNYHILTGLTLGKQVFVKVAAYDTFGKSYAGTGLNVSGGIAGTALIYPGVPEYAVLPTTPTPVDKQWAYNTTDKALYQYDAAAAIWRRNGFASGATTPTAANGKNGDQFLNTTDGKLYFHNGTAWVAQVGDIRANSIVAAMMQAGIITANELAANSVTFGKVAANAIDVTNIKVGTLTGDRFVANTITGDRIVNNTLTSVQIAAYSITADRITTGSLAAISANIGYCSAGQISINSDNAGGWGYIRSGAKWLDGNWGWCFAQHANGGMFFDLCLNNFRFWAQHDVNVSANWNFSAPGISMSQAGLTISQGNAINWFNIAGGAACTMSWGQGTGAAYAGINVPSGTTAIVHCVAFHRGRGQTSGNIGQQAVSLSGIGDEPVYPTNYSRVVFSGESGDQFEPVHTISGTSVTSLIALGGGSYTLSSGNSWGGFSTLACTVAVRP